MLDKIKLTILPVLDELAVQLYDLEYVQEANENYLRVFIDNEAGIDLETIVEVSRAISDRLDEVDPIEAEYILEVSSPGAEKPLKEKQHFIAALNQYIRVELLEPKAGVDAVEGYLVEYSDDDLIVEYLDKTRKKKLKIDLTNIKKARLAIKF